MRLVTNLPLFGRNLCFRPTALPRPPSVSLPFARHASRLSGVHEGLRRSERARPQGARFKKEIRQSQEEEPYLSPEERQRARALARRNPLTYKIHKGKKDITEEPGPRRKSRAARLSDPRDPLGQGSLLKRFKTGQLLDELKNADKGRQREHLQHDDFVRHMATAQVEQLMENRKPPVWKTSREEKRRVTRSDRADFGSRKPGEDTQGNRDRLDRGPRDRFSSPPGSGFGRDRNGAQRDIIDQGPRDKLTSPPESRFGRARNGREGDISERGPRDSFSSPPKSGFRDRNIEERDMFKRGPRDSFSSPPKSGFNRDSNDEEMDIFGRGSRDSFSSPPKSGFNRDSDDEEMDIFGRGSRDSFSSPPESGSDQESNGAERDIFGRGHRDSPAPENDFGLYGNDRERPREGKKFAEPDRRVTHRENPEDRFGQMAPERLDRESSRKPVGRDEKPEPAFRSERTRFMEVGHDGSHQGDAAGDAVSQAAERKRQQYVPPPSVPYTTAASQFLYGTSTVEAALQNSRRKLYKLYIYRGGNRRNREKDIYITNLASQRGVRIVYLDEYGLSMLNKMSDNRPHNGYVLEASPLPQMPVMALGEVSDANSRPGFKVSMGYQSREDADINGTDDFIITEPDSHNPFVLLLDQVLDPGNLGAILRTASFMGVTAVAITKRGSAPITPVVLKASAGAAEALTLFSVDSPVDFVRESSANGWKIYAAVAPKPGREAQDLDTRSVEQSDPLLGSPCVLVLGSEGEGLSRQLTRAANFNVSIPNMSGSKVVDSLNVSVATGLLCSAFLRGKINAARGSILDAGALF